MRIALCTFASCIFASGFTLEETEATSSEDLEIQANPIGLSGFTIGIENRKTYAIASAQSRKCKSIVDPSLEKRRATYSSGFRC